MNCAVCTPPPPPSAWDLQWNLSLMYQLLSHMPNGCQWVHIPYNAAIGTGLKCIVWGWLHRIKFLCGVLYPPDTCVFAIACQIPKTVFYAHSGALRTGTSAFATQFCVFCMQHSRNWTKSMVSKHHPLCSPTPSPAMTSQLDTPISRLWTYGFCSVVCATV